MGTLKGMITSFSAIAMGGENLSPQEVAKGISEALLLTFEGVFLSIPAIFLFSLFSTAFRRSRCKRWSAPTSSCGTLPTRLAARPQPAVAGGRRGGGRGEDCTTVVGNLKLRISDFRLQVSSNWAAADAQVRIEPAVSAGVEK